MFRWGLGISWLLAVLLVVSSPAAGWSNGGWSDNRYSPDYGTHDYLLEHALDMLPAEEHGVLVDNLSLVLYGSELPDRPRADGGFHDGYRHHVYYNLTGQMTDDSSAVRAEEEFQAALDILKSGGSGVDADLAVGAMSHYIVDVAGFGHVMGASTPWGSEDSNNHRNYEGCVQRRTRTYTSVVFDSYLKPGGLDDVSAYNATLRLAYNITFGTEGLPNAVWMDDYYSCLPSTYRNATGVSLNLAVNALADALHTLYLEQRLPGDADGNGCVNFVDFTILALSWQKTAGEAGFDARADFNRDGAVNFTDFTILALHWQECRG